MSRNLLFKILIVFWALALIVIGVVQFKKGKSCSSCQAETSFVDTLTESQKEKLNKRNAVILIPDYGDPIYVDEDIAFNHAQVTAFSYAEPPTLTEEEEKHALASLRFRKYLLLAPENLHQLLREKKLDVLLNKDGIPFAVALSDSMKDY